MQTIYFWKTNEEHVRLTMFGESDSLLKKQKVISNIGA